MAETKLKGVIELTAKPIKVDEAAAKLKDSVQEAFRAGGAGGLSDAAGSAGTHLSGIMSYGKTASAGLSGAAQNLKGLLSGALGAAESGTKSGLIASAGGLIEGLGVTALGGAGMAALGMVATIGFVKAIANASHGLQEFNYKLGGDVGAMAVVKGILGLQNTMLQLQVGSKLAPSAMKLGEANFEFKSKLENALVPVIQELNTNMAKLITELIPLIPAMVSVAADLTRLGTGFLKNVVAGAGAGSGVEPMSLTSKLGKSMLSPGFLMGEIAGGIPKAIGDIGQGWDAAKQFTRSQFMLAGQGLRGANNQVDQWFGKFGLGPSAHRIPLIEPRVASPAVGVHPLAKHNEDLKGFARVIGVPGVGVHPLAKHAEEAHHKIGALKEKQKAADAEKLLGKISKGIDHLNTKAEKTNNFLQQLTPEERGSAMGFLTFMDRLARVHPGKGHKADRQQLWEDKFDKKVQAKLKSGVHALANPGWMKVPKKSPHTLKGYVNPDGAA